MIRFVCLFTLTASLAWILGAARLAGAQETTDPYDKKEILVFTPTWSEPETVLPFLQEKVEKLLLENPGKHAWNFLQVGYIPLFLRSHIRKSENNYQFHLAISLRTGEEILVIEGTCDICNTTEALGKLSELKDEVCDRLEEKAKEAERIRKENAALQPVKPVLKKTVPETRVVGVLSEPKPFVMPPWTIPPPPVKLWSWMGASLSLTAVVTGIVLIAMDGDHTCDAPYPEKQCTERYSTGGAGWTFLLGGLVGGGFSGWSLYNMYFKKPDLVPTVVPTAGSGKAGLLLEWKF